MKIRTMLKLLFLQYLYKYVIRIKNDKIRLYLKQRILNEYQPKNIIEQF